MAESPVSPLVAEHFDTIIVGAGLSGIAAAYHLQRGCPGKTYAILEARASIGGTWDLFRYPGVRSDSDMFTLGYSFRPWTNPKAIADGASILQYVRDTASELGIDRHIRFHRRVETMRWSSATSRWTLGVRDTRTNELVDLTCGFAVGCTGYYDYDQGYTPDLPGLATFQGRLVHPQHWPADLDVTGKRVVVIGSGATAVTLVPELAKTAAHVTMLQRSPTYIVSVPSQDKVADWLRAKLPAGLAHEITRWKNVLIGLASFQYSRRYPAQMTKWLLARAERQLGGAADVKTHFTPSYKPWDQRLCLIPDGDLFEALKSKRAEVVTDHIASLDASGIVLRSGARLDADVVVTATGLQLKLFGGIALSLDGVAVDPATLLVYKGIMCSGVPNFAFAIGYTNASWTLKADLTAQYVTRLLRYMDEHGFSACIPKRDDTVEELPLLDFSSGYVTRAIQGFPRQGHIRPWRLFQNYALDLLMIRHSKIADATMEFTAARDLPVATVRRAG